LADFGLSRVIAGFTSSGTGEQDGTTAYMSPELLWPEKYGLEAAKPTTKSDIFALGIVIYEVRPFSVV
jgi:serine/threonine protein kinase